MSERNPGSRPLAKWLRHGEIRVDEQGPLIRLDLYLARRFTYRSRNQWVRMIDSGRILLNGSQVRPSRVVSAGDRIDYRPLPRVEPPVNAAIPILHEDAALLAVDKPAHLPVHPSGRYFRHTLLLRLLELRGETLDEPGIRIVHRLDRETSGVVLFGRSRHAAAFLAHQFERHQVEKEYLVLAHGIPERPRFLIDAELGPDLSSRVRKAVGTVAPGTGRPALTEFEVLAAGPAHCLLRARPRTGRLHQIRVHLKHAGHPVVGDKLYGLDERFFLMLAAGMEYSEEDRRRLVSNRQGLHAHRITVIHPETKSPFTCIAPLPPDLVGLCRKLGIDPPAEVAGSTTGR